jgi:hypothetical protein
VFSLIPLYVEVKTRIELATYELWVNSEQLLPK